MKLQSHVQRLWLKARIKRAPGLTRVLCCNNPSFWLSAVVLVSIWLGLLRASVQVVDRCTSPDSLEFFLLDIWWCFCLLEFFGRWTFGSPCPIARCNGIWIEPVSWRPRHFQYIPSMQPPIEPVPRDLCNTSLPSSPQHVGIFGSWFL